MATLVGHIVDQWLSICAARCLKLSCPIRRLASACHKISKEKNVSLVELESVSASQS